MTSNLNFAQNLNYNSYHPSYRSMIVSSFPGEPAPVVFCDQQASLPLDSVTSGRDSYFIWNKENFSTYANALNRPWIHLNGDYVIYNELGFSPEQIAAFKKYGLNIFNHEPLFIYNADGSWPWNKRLGPPRYFELEKISQFVRKHGISPVTIYLCEHKMADELRHHPLFHNLNFKHWNSYFTKIVEKERWSRFQSPPREPSKRFICPNFRYEAIREILAAYFVGQNYDQNSYLSFFHRHNRKEFLSRLPFDPSKLKQWPIIEAGIEKMQSRLPLVIETANVKTMDSASEPHPDLSGSENLRDDGVLRTRYVPMAFAYTYCESRPFSPSSEISEKTIIPIFAQKPFVPFASPKFLSHVRDLGFQTFADFWDESYDEIENPTERLSEFLKVVDFIARKTPAEVSALNKALKPVVDFNLDWAMNHVLEKEKTRLWTT